MLVLTLTANQSLVITLPDGRPVVISVNEIIRGHKTRLGVEADRSIPVHRGEVHEAIQRGKAVRP